MCYAGSPALKRELVSTGRVTLRGKVADKFVSLSRWAKNNFRQGKSQDTLDLMLGESVTGWDWKASHDRVRKSQLTFLVAAGPVAWAAVVLALCLHFEEPSTALAWGTACWCVFTLCIFVMVLQGKAGKWAEPFIEVPASAV